MSTKRRSPKADSLESVKSADMAVLAELLEQVRSMREQMNVLQAEMRETRLQPPTESDQQVETPALESVLGSENSNLEAEVAFALENPDGPAWEMSTPDEDEVLDDNLESHELGEEFQYLVEDVQKFNFSIGSESVTQEEIDSLLDGMQDLYNELDSNQDAAEPDLRIVTSELPENGASVTVESQAVSTGGSASLSIHPAEEAQSEELEIAVKSSEPIEESVLPEDTDIQTVLDTETGHDAAEDRSHLPEDKILSESIEFEGAEIVSEFIETGKQSAVETSNEPVAEENIEIDFQAPDENPGEAEDELSEESQEVASESGDEVNPAESTSIGETILEVAGSSPDLLAAETANDAALDELAADGSGAAENSAENGAANHPNVTLSDDEIEAMIDAASAQEISTELTIEPPELLMSESDVEIARPAGDVAETVDAPIPVETNKEVSSSENRVSMSDDEINALMAAAAGGAPVQAVKDPATTDNPGAPMSDDEINALIAAASGGVPVEAVQETAPADTAEAPVSDDEISALIAAASGGAPVQALKDPETAEDHKAPKSDDELPALLTTASDGATLDAVQETAQPEDASTSMTDDEISSHLGAAGEEADPDSDSDEEELLSESELADLVRQMINEQAETLDSTPEERDDSTSSEPKSVVEADALAALLHEPDPEDQSGPVPTQSSAMDPDELAKLMSEATAMARETGTIGGVAPLSSGFEPEEVAEEGAESAPAPVDTVAFSSIEVEINLAAVRVVPASLAIRALALPIGFHENQLVCKIAEPVDQAAVDFLSHAIGQSITAQPAPIEEVVAGLRVAYSQVFVDQARLAVKRKGKRVRKLKEIAKVFKRSA